MLASRRVAAPRRLSQAISEGDGISLIVEVDGPRVRRGGGEGEARRPWSSAPTAATRAPCAPPPPLPLILVGDDTHGVADACVVPVGGQAPDGDSELVYNVTSDEELEDVLERHDPEILLLAPGADGVEPVLELLADVPAGKLAIGVLWEPAADELAELERAGCDAVLVGARASTA